MLTLLAVPRWTMQTSGVSVRLRGVSAVSERVAWASGAESTILRTVDSGATWQKLAVTSDVLDFRDVDAVDAQTAYILSIGNGPASRIYKTTDTGKNKMVWPQYLDRDRRVQHAFGVRAFPTYIVIDHEGIVRFQSVGTSWQRSSNLNDAISKHVKIVAKSVEAR